VVENIEFRNRGGMILRAPYTSFARRDSRPRHTEPSVSSRLRPASVSHSMLDIWSEKLFSCKLRSETGCSRLKRGLR
jgi:hypothetical protein